MADSKLKEFKKPMILVAILLAVIAGFIYNRIRINDKINEEEQAVEIVQNRFAGQELDTTVLTDDKFKELQAIPKMDIGLGDDISEDELARVKRRYSNPFLPFD